MIERRPIPRIYLDTSVIGGCLDKEFREASRKLVTRGRTGQAMLVISEVTVAELVGAPREVQGILTTLPRSCIEYIHQTPESEALAEAYIAHAVLPSGMLVDAQHIALATIARVDVLVSWNFKHIVNLNRIHAFNAVNLLTGFPQIEIRSPLEV